MSGGTKEQETELNNRRVVVTMAARSIFVDAKLFFSSCFSYQLDRKAGMDDISFPLPSLPVLSAE